MIGQSSGNAGPAVSQSSSRFPSRVKMVQTHVTQSQTIPGKKIEKRQSNQPEIKLPDMSACPINRQATINAIITRQKERKKQQFTTPSDPNSASEQSMADLFYLKNVLANITLKIV